MDKTVAEEELFILEQGIKQPFWQLLEHKWSNFLIQTKKELLTSNCPNRDFVAGKLLGMTNLCNYPLKHIETCKKQLEGKKE